MAWQNKKDSCHEEAAPRAQESPWRSYTSHHTPRIAKIRYHCGIGVFVHVVQQYIYSFVSSKCRSLPAVWSGKFKVYHLSPFCARTRHRNRPV